MTSDGILEKELRERFGVDSIVSHLDGNVVVTLKPEAFDRLCDDEGMYDEEYLDAAVGEADAAGQEAGREAGYQEGYSEAVDIISLMRDEVWEAGHDQGYQDALTDIEDLAVTS